MMPASAQRLRTVLIKIKAGLPTIVARGAAGGYDPIPLERWLPAMQGGRGSSRMARDRAAGAVVAASPGLSAIFLGFQALESVCPETCQPIIILCLVPLEIET
jgi:hypothetical protein